MHNLRWKLWLQLIKKLVKGISNCFLASMICCSARNPPLLSSWHPYDSLPVRAPDKLRVTIHLPYYNELWAMVLSPRLQERQLQLDPDHFGALLPLMWVAKPPMAIWEWTSACSGHQLGGLSVQITLAYLFHWFIWSPQIIKNPAETLPWLFTKHKDCIQCAIPGSLLGCTQGFLLERLHHLMRSNICTLNTIQCEYFSFFTNSLHILHWSRWVLSCM